MEPIGMEVRDGIALVRLQHGKANALDLEMCRSLVLRAGDCGTPEVKAVVMTGGGRMFSAGVDLVRLTNSGPEYVSEFVPALIATVGAWFALEKPVVAAVNGHAVAGGCILACVADVRLMAAGSGRIGVPELRVGVPFPTSALEVVRFAVGPQHVQAVVYGGATYEPEEARAVGLIDEVVPAESLQELAWRRASELAGVDPRVFAVTKRQLRAGALERIRRGAEEHDPLVADLWARPETIERVRGYIERTFRPPSS